MYGSIAYDLPAYKVSLHKVLSLQILEKLKMHGASSSTNGVGDGFRSAFSAGAGASGGASPVKRPFEVMSKLAGPPTSGNSSGSDTAGSPTVKKFKPAGFSFGASFGSPPHPQPPPSSANNT